ncbi:DUF917 family protein [Candidatus Leptofilum sp.]|uniref:S-methyl thiohydantoin desulfurase domain-containing protein n=1 Tax=Candidatus Leptofilum sp. TaxID=3241576 RepID=UPI003B595819
MNLKTNLDALTMETAVLGGAVLGGGGGGKLEDGLHLGALATAQGGACLLDSASLPQMIVAAVMPVYTSSHQTHQIDPIQIHCALETLQHELGTAVSGLVSGGSGAVETMIGWELSAYSNIPLLDACVPATFHPAALQNLLLFLCETAVSQRFTICLVNNHQQAQIWNGQPTQLLQQLTALPPDATYIAAVGPLSPTALTCQASKSSISDALRIGQLLLATNDNGGEDTIVALQTILPTQFSTFASVTEISWHGQGQEAYGLIHMRDVANRQLQLTYGQRYTKLSVDNKKIAAFPDLIITLGTLGTPLTGEEVFLGQDLYLIVARQERPLRNCLSI